MKISLAFIGFLTTASGFSSAPQAFAPVSRSSFTALQLVADEFVDSEIESNDVRQQYWSLHTRKRIFHDPDQYRKQLTRFDFSYLHNRL